MTDTPAHTARRSRRTVVTLLGVTTVLLLPALIALWHAAADALQHPTASQADREAKKALAHTALQGLGMPVAGAVCGWTSAAILDRRTGVSMAAGALIGTVGQWIFGVVWFYAAFAGAPIHF
ncbi:hypothetical protein [Streptomyces sp. NPDC127084]|uniref:hypothetical protein n=1 Tax=Streptomyces sp. NPDC127084 TaxID=3347133 RepID=UPI00364B435A